MNLSAPDAPQPGGRPEGAVLRFLRWLIEPPVGPQPAGSRVLRWLFRAVAFLFAAFVAGEAGVNDVGSGMGGARKDKSGKPPA